MFSRMILSIFPLFLIGIVAMLIVKRCTKLQIETGPRISLIIKNSFRYSKDNLSF